MAEGGRYCTDFLRRGGGRDGGCPGTSPDLSDFLASPLLCCIPSESSARATRRHRPSWPPAWLILPRHGTWCATELLVCSLMRKG